MLLLCKMTGMHNELPNSINTQPCYEGWGITDNKQGRCCCNCQYQLPIVSHPWNHDPFVKGPVSDIIGWGCHAPDLLPYVTFFERQNSMCESHTFRDKK